MLSPNFEKLADYEVVLYDYYDFLDLELRNLLLNLLKKDIDVLVCLD